MTFRLHQNHVGVGIGVELFIAVEEVLLSLDGYLCDLLKQDWGNITAGMKWKRRATAVGVSVLFVGTSLPDFVEAQFFENGGNLFRFQHRSFAHYAT
jgi:hypothetical protein